VCGGSDYIQLAKGGNHCAAWTRSPGTVFWDRTVSDHWLSAFSTSDGRLVSWVLYIIWKRFSVLKYAAIDYFVNCVCNLIFGPHDKLETTVVLQSPNLCIRRDVCLGRGAIRIKDLF